MTADVGQPVDLDRIEAAVAEILVALGEDPSRDGLQETPARVARMYAEVCSGLHEDCLLYTSPSPRDLSTSRMPSSA